MNLTILFMVFLAMTLAFIFVAAYLWATGSGQFDDLQTPALRILKDDLDVNEEKKRDLHATK